MARPLVALAEVRGAMFPFLPVCLGLGIAGWFALPWEPARWVYAALAGLVLLGGGLTWRGPYLWQPVALALTFVALGFGVTGVRAHWVAAPVLGFQYYGPVEGRVVEVDRNASDKLRITLDHVVLSRMEPERTPARVRISIHGDWTMPPPKPGARVMTTAFLGAPMPPTEPGGFDFRRMAWFDRLGGIGYTRVPVLALAPPESGAQIIGRIRAFLSSRIQEQVPGQAGAFAAGSVTGDRSGITQSTVEALRDSNLSHLLAISGMNLAFLVAFTFGLVRYGLALIPFAALYLNTKKLAACAALAVSGFYLALSGGNVATERAFIMAAIMLGAILCDRRAISLRTAALSALVLLLWQPESLMNVGFQMSMAATVALIWGFGLVDRMTFRGRLPQWSVPVYTAVLSSVIGGLATGPIAASQFNRYAEYGLLANMLTVPAMGMLMMPGAVLASIFGPLGLPQPGMWLMEAGGRWILAVAHWVAGFGGAVRGIPAPPGPVMPMLYLAALWMVIWPTQARWAALAPMAVAAGLWMSGARPEVLIAADGGVVGVTTAQGRALSFPTGSGFAAANWLERDGDLASQKDAAERAGFHRDATGARVADLSGRALVHLKGKGAPAHVATYCKDGAVVVLGAEWPDLPPEGCLLLDRIALARTGAISIGMDGGRMVMRAALDTARLWDGDRPSLPDQ
nr:ComEC/Rec2 family competence protein [Falsirhodobacter halotolerans]